MSHDEVELAVLIEIHGRESLQGGVRDAGGIRASLEGAVSHSHQDVDRLFAGNHEVGLFVSIEVGGRDPDWIGVDADVGSGREGLRLHAPGER